MSREISNSDDVIDSREIIERIDELREEIESAGIPDNEIGGPSDTMTDERAELAALEALQDEAEGYDWKHGSTLIRDSYFQEYAQELAEDIGAIPKDSTWPAYCIDWEWAARELRMDYSAVEFGDVTYWIR